MILLRFQKPWFLSVTCFIALLSANTYSNQGTPLANYFADTWTTEDGLPHNSINAIAQTSDGYLWFATWEGVARYNGSEFRFFERSEQTGIIDSGTRTLVPDSENGLWIAGARGGVTYRNHQQWQPQPPAQSMVNHVMKDSKDNLWLAVEGMGVFFRPTQESDGAPPSDSEVWVLKNKSAYRLLEDSQGRIWAATDSGLYHLNGDSQQDVLAQYNLPNRQVYSVIETRDKELLVATNRGAYVIKDSQAFLLHPSLAGATITTLLEDKQNNIWLGTVNLGVFRYAHQKIEKLSADSGLPNNRVLSIFQDLENSIWIGTNGGLMRLRNAPFSSWTKERGLVGDYVRSVIELSPGSLLVGSSEGLSIIEKDLAYSALNQKSAQVSTLSFARRQAGGVWVGTYLNGLMVWQDNQLTPYFNEKNGLPSNEVRAVLEDTKGNLWIGTTTGLVRRNAQGEQTLFTREQGLPGNYIMALSEDTKGQIWVGTGVGVAIITGNEINTLSINAMEGAEYAFGFWPEKDYVWIATDRGLIRYRHKDGHLGLVGRKAGLPIDKLFQVISDNHGSLWLTSNRGIWQVAYDSAQAVADGKQENIDFEHFSQSDGMASAQANGGSNPTAVVMSNGTLWFATAKGVSMINSLRLTEKIARPLPLVLESVFVDGELVDSTQNATFKPGTSRVAIHYAGLGYVLSSRIQYRTHLVGFEEGWSFRDKGTTAEYTNLPPGHYQLKLSARYPYNDWTPSETLYEFTIQPFIWQTREMQISAFVVLLLLLTAGVKWRLRQLQANELRLKKLVDKQTFALQQQTEELRCLANEDGLTHLPNRRAFDRSLSSTFANAKSQGTSLALAILDIDHFKAINDHYSHLVGDQAIQLIAKELHAMTNDNVHVARWGGEEFTLLIEGIEDHQAISYCDHLREKIANLDYTDLGENFAMTVSIGLAFSDQVRSYEDLLRSADKALYRAKQEGRNRVEHE